MNDGLGLGSTVPTQRPRFGCRCRLCREAALPAELLTAGEIAALADVLPPEVAVVPLCAGCRAWTVRVGRMARDKALEVRP